MIRVLHVLGGTYLAGAESRIMDMYREIDREHVQFDFVVHSKPDYYDAEILSLGGKIYRLPRFKIYNFFSYRKAWKQFLKEHHEYAAIHGHMTSTAAIYLPLAKKAGIPITIAHARSAGVDRSLKGFVTRMIRKPLKNKADFLFTCSELAGRAVYGDKVYDQGRVKLVPNAIGTQKFVYNPEVREKMRNEWKLDGKVVYGHIGTFRYAKNHSFLLEVFAEIKKMQKDAVLFLVGDGELRSEIEAKIAELGLQESVILAGKQSNVGDYCQMMDVLLFPSHFEGLPGTILEAQVAGLPCLISDAITREVGISELVIYKSLEESAKEWAQVAVTLPQKDRKSGLKAVQKAGFDVTDQASKMIAFYQSGDLKVFD